jgi:hypothetical protein
VDSEAELPADLDPISSFALVGEDGTVWYGRSSGYLWFRPATATRECFRKVTNGRFVVG